MSRLVPIDLVDHDALSVVTVGTFDGVHAGHRYLIQKLVDRAKELQCRSVVVTFDPHPREILQPGHQGIGLLTSLEERAELLGQLGVDLMVVIPFDRDFSLMSSDSFLKEIIYDKIGLKTFIIGYDHHFGKDREGDKSTVEQIGRDLGFTVEVVEAREINQVIVSSSLARRSLINEGDIHSVKECLGRSYQLSGIVVYGDGRGRSIGYPTANVRSLNTRKIIPKNGVYAVWVDIDDRTFAGMMNIGVRPTFGIHDERTLEVHLIDFDQDIYGKKIRIHFESRLRDEMKFDSVEALKAQLQLDRMLAIQRLKS
jgi:riboflavin kinase / FMN adenylyltransferase